MNDTFRQALVAGYECLAAWADLLDRINVFPIADGDTGRNLVISLSPLRGPERDISELRKELLRSARGNSGNIASAFFRCFLTGDNADQLPDAVRRGRDEAWRSVPDPRPGTMLTFFDTLTECFQKPWSGETLSGLRIRLEDAVRATITQQPQLRRAGVVDAGALGMYLFFEGFMPVYAGGAPVVRSVTETFGDLVRLSPSYCDEPERGYCVDVMIETGGDAHQAEARPSLPGESIVVSRRGKCLKIHLHTHDLEEVRSRLRPLGKILGWAEDDLYRQTANFNRPGRDDSVHIMTDAAGSLTREEAALMDVSLLDSYIVIGKQCLPETCLAPSVLYDAMRSGIRVSTSQASVFERHQHYTNVMGRHERVLYLCVGSAYTGNYETAVAWKKNHDPQDRMTVIDTGTASGRLALIVLAVAAFAKGKKRPEDVAAFAGDAVKNAEEYIFLDRLAYLAAGGRLSKSGAFFGDMLRMKPVVTPLADGAKKAGLCRSREEQEVFALKTLEKSLAPDEGGFILLEYSDNHDQVEAFSHAVRNRYPRSRVVVHPLSLTSGAHMGPGAWAVAFYRNFPE